MNNLCHRKPKQSVLLVSNYSNETGYAWKNIYRLFNAIGKSLRKYGLGVFISFRSIKEPITCIENNSQDGMFELPPFPSSKSDFQQWYFHIRRRNIRYVYLTDRGAIDWRYALYRMFGVRRIVVHNRISVADPNPAMEDQGIRGLYKQCRALCHPLMADRVYAVSDFVRERLIRKERIPESRVVKILNGIDIEKFRPSRHRKNDRDPLVVFTGGRATKHKGIQVLIEAIASIHRREKQLNIAVLYAGDGPEINEYKTLVDRRGLSNIFKFLGEVPSTEGYVSCADVVVVPSIWGDACPSTVSEAMASGKALIATHVGGVPEIVGNEDNAILIPPNDSKVLGEALFDILTDSRKRERLGENARRRAENALDERMYHKRVIDQLSADLGL